GALHGIPSRHPPGRCSAPRPAKGSAQPLHAPWPAWLPPATLERFPPRRLRMVHIAHGYIKSSSVFFITAMPPVNDMAVPPRQFIPYPLRVVRRCHMAIKAFAHGIQRMRILPLPHQCPLDLLLQRLPVFVSGIVAVTKG